MTDTELKKLALDMVSGNIFTNRHLRRGDEHRASHVWLPLFMMSKEQMKEFKEADIGLIYEYKNCALATGIQGEYPSFPSARTLTKKQTSRMMNFYQEIESFLSEKRVIV